MSLSLSPSSLVSHPRRQLCEGRSLQMTSAPHTPTAPSRWEACPGVGRPVSELLQPPMGDAGEKAAENRAVGCPAASRFPVSPSARSPETAGRPWDPVGCSHPCAWLRWLCPCGVSMSTGRGLQRAHSHTSAAPTLGSGLDPASGLEPGGSSLHSPLTPQHLPSGAGFAPPPPPRLPPNKVAGPSRTRPGLVHWFLLHRSFDSVSPVSGTTASDLPANDLLLSQ